MREIKVTAAASLLLLAATATSHASVSECFESVTRTVDAFHSALKSGDADAAKSTLADNLLVYEQGWVERSKAEYVTNHLESDVKFAQATTSEVTQRSCSTISAFAYVSTEGHTTGTFEGKPVDSITLETMILRHDGQAWHIVHIHWSSRKPK